MSDLPESLKPDFLKMLEGCGSIHDQVAQLDKWYEQDLQPVLRDAMKVIKKHKTMSLSHYVDCKYYDDDNEDECDSVCDCPRCNYTHKIYGVWQLYCENKKALAKLREVMGEGDVF